MYTTVTVWKKGCTASKEAGARQAPTQASGTQSKIMLLRRKKGQTSVTSVCDVNDIVVHDKGSNCNKSRNTLKPI